MTQSELNAIIEAILNLRSNATDEVALQSIGIYPSYDNLVAQYQEKVDAGEQPDQYDKGFRFKYQNKLYRTEQLKTTFNGVYAPGVGTESLYSEVSLPGSGTIDNPIAYNNNMELVKDLYYIQDGIKYLCIRDTGVPVYNPLSQLVGLYVEMVLESESQIVNIGGKESFM